MGQRGATRCRPWFARLALSSLSLSLPTSPLCAARHVLPKLVRPSRSWQRSHTASRRALQRHAPPRIFRSPSDLSCPSSASSLRGCWPPCLLDSFLLLAAHPASSQRANLDRTPSRRTPASPSAWSRLVRPARRRLQPLVSLAMSFGALSAVGACVQIVKTLYEYHAGVSSVPLLLCSRELHLVLELTSSTSHSPLGTRSHGLCFGSRA